MVQTAEDAEDAQQCHEARSCTVYLYVAAAIVAAHATGNIGKAVGQPSSGPGPAMEKRNIFSLFRIWLGRQGGQAALQALVKEADARGEGAAAAASGSIGVDSGKADGALDLYEVQQLLMKVWMV